MEFLGKRLAAGILLLPLFVFLGCSPSTTVTSYIETDTYISSTDSANHSDLGFLKVSKTSSLEERTVFKLPTGKGTLDSNLSDLFSGPLSETPLNPFFVLDAILQAIFGCTQYSLVPGQLSSAQLEFDVSDSGAQSLAGLISLKLLSRPWWQNMDWLHAHFFSAQGVWAQPGGDFDPSFTPIAATVSGNTISFDVTTYFQSLISSASPVHYGMMLVASPATLQPVTLLSAQNQGASSTGAGPRVVSTYNCISSSNFEQQHEDNIIHHTYYLGSMSQKSN